MIAEDKKKKTKKNKRPGKRDREIAKLKAESRDASPSSSTGSVMKQNNECIFGEAGSSDQELSKKIKRAVEEEDDDYDGWKFEVDYNDHFETPPVAYFDLLPLLEQVAKSCNKAVQDLVIYDPYYCKGQIRGILQEMGLRNVINRNRDFYADIANDALPPHFDVVVTNPPYSGDHKSRLLAFLSR